MLGLTELAMLSRMKSDNSSRHAGAAQPSAASAVSPCVAIGAMIGLVLPTIATWVYFVLAADDPEGVQRAIGLATKFAQFVFPIIWVRFALKERIQLPPARFSGVPLGLLFAVAITLSGWIIFEQFLRDSSTFAAAIQPIREKVAGFWPRFTGEIHCAWRVLFTRPFAVGGILLALVRVRAVAARVADLARDQRFCGRLRRPPRDHPCDVFRLGVVADRAVLRRGCRRWRVLGLALPAHRLARRLLAQSPGHRRRHLRHRLPPAPHDVDVSAVSKGIAPLARNPRGGGSRGARGD